MALVELYGGETCSRCAPAERWLAGLTPGQSLVAVALYVESRQYSGQTPARPRRLTVRQRMALVSAPLVLLQGEGFAAWGTGAFEAAVGRINATPARAALELEIVAVTGAGLQVRMSAEVPDAAQRADAALFLAAYENRGGRVVFEWLGPFRPGRSQEKSLPLLPGALPARSGVVAFVQNRRTAEVLQALMLPACL